MSSRRCACAALVLAGLLIAVPAARAQWFWGLAYEPSISMGELKDFSDNSFSWRGVGFDGRRWLRNELSVGFSVSWNVFYHEFSETHFTRPGQDIFGTQLRDVNTLPIFLNAHFYTGEAYHWRWFFGLNLGTIYADYRLDMGLYNYREDNWHLAVAPEVGLKFPYNIPLGYVALRWNYAFSAGETDEVSYLALRLGIGLR